MGASSMSARPHEPAEYPSVWILWQRGPIDSGSRWVADQSHSQLSWSDTGISSMDSSESTPRGFGHFSGVPVLCTSSHSSHKLLASEDRKTSRS